MRRMNPPEVDIVVTLTNDERNELGEIFKISGEVFIRYDKPLLTGGRLPAEESYSSGLRSATEYVPGEALLASENYLFPCKHMVSL